ncbi:MAG: hypothetical protein HY300_10050 [Verrucomicrobia bacterium]|nr:hypothetical protein [Verrucomicrobiota bacterium]
MINPRQKPLLYAGVAIVAIWLLAWGGYAFAKSRKITAEKVAAAVNQTDLSQLSADARRKALRKLAAMMNSLPIEERRNARMESDWDKFFATMTEEERVEFIESTLPTGVKQMLASFEELPADRRSRIVRDSIKRLQESQQHLQSQGRQARPPLSDESQKRITAIGLGAFYSQSSAQTKAEVAPLLEELQRSMESGRFMPR